MKRKENFPDFRSYTRQCFLNEKLTNCNRKIKYSRIFLHINTGISAENIAALLGFRYQLFQHLHTTPYFLNF